MDIESLKSMVMTDMKIDPVLLDTESLNTSVLHGKYLSLLLDESKRMKRLVRSKKQLERTLVEYYMGRADDEVYKRKGEFNLKVLKPDITMYVESDCEYLDLQEEIDDAEEKIKFLEQVIRQINGRNYAIKNAIDWRRFSNGLN